MSYYATGILWRDTARTVRFFVFDAKVLWGLMLWALHITETTFYVALGFMCVFTILELFGMRPIPALRVLKNFWANGMRRRRMTFHMYRRARRW